MGSDHRDTRGEGILREPASFGARLKGQREQRGVSLRSIADSTKISASYFAALERGDCSRWPAGVYSRAFVRAYAEAIGLDPDTVASDFFHCYPALAVPASQTASAASRPRDAAPSALAAPRTNLRLGLVESPADRARERGTKLRRVVTELGAVLALAGIIGAANGQFWMALAVALATRQIVGALTIAPGAELETVAEEVDASPAPLPDAEPVV
jgi:transcriptional regulator with XRE-family HTH domain